MGHIEDDILETLATYLPPDRSHDGQDKRGIDPIGLDPEFDLHSAFPPSASFRPLYFADCSRSKIVTTTPSSTIRTRPVSGCQRASSPLKGLDSIAIL